MAGVADISRMVNPTNMLEGIHIGAVVDNNDPEKRGRVRVAVPIFSSLPTSDIPWASVVHPAGIGGSPTLSSFSVPEIGSKVSVLFIAGTVYTPIVIGILQDASTHQADFDTNYPDRYGFKDPNGLTTVIDKRAKTVSIVHVSGAAVSISAAGDITISHPGNLNMTTGGTFTITSGGNMKFKAPRIDLN